MTLPLSVGQIPCHYHDRPSACFRKYLDEKTGFLDLFGSGLAYSADMKGWTIQRERFGYVQPGLENINN